MALRSLAIRLMPVGKLSARGTLATSGVSSSLRASLQPIKRSYSTQQSKDGGSNIMLFIGLIALGGAANYYYDRNPDLFGAAKKVENTPVDDEQVYKDNVEIPENKE